MPEPAPRTPTNPADVRNAIDAVTQRYVNGPTSVPGAAVAVVDLRSPNLAAGYASCAGRSDLRTDEPVTASTPFPIGSVTKLFTSLLTALSVVQGRASLSDSVSDYLHLDPPIASVAGLHRVTLLELATHTSGMEDLAGGVSVELFDDEPASARLVDYWRSYAPPPDLPACWCYSNRGFVTLGFAVSGLFGMTGNAYNTLLADEVTAPLGLQSTTAHPAVPYATGYVWQDQTNQPTDTIPADLKSTASDMITFLRATLADPSLPLPTELADALLLIRADHGSYPICHSTHDMLMGLGWQQPLIGGGSGPTRMLYKNGEVPGYSCALEVVPTQGIGVAALTNQSIAPRPSPPEQPTSPPLHPPQTATQLAGALRETLRPSRV
ncbi:serine hydrolase domain-containing protein [Microlunatus ginsengisoli]|uniref:Serine hydrolase n=1 Tax=Microlunatus ginsengisoli TaxID=363863 RepID=A0ABP7AYS2_9ACTN